MDANSFLAKATEIGAKRSLRLAAYILSLQGLEQYLRIDLGSACTIGDAQQMHEVNIKTQCRVTY